MPKSSAKTRYHLLDADLIEKISRADEDEQSQWLILSRHPDFRGRWIVDCLYPYFQFDLEPIIGSYRSVSPATLDEFLSTAEDLEYHVAFSDDPTRILDAWEHLNDPPPFEIVSDLEGTINGLLPFQIQGYNFLMNPDNKGGMAMWSTGTGKTVLMIALVKGHLIQDDFDIAICVVKSNNKINTQRKLKLMGGLDSVVLEGENQDARLAVYAEADVDSEHEPVIAITNYEKFRDDEPYMKMLFHEKRVMVFWDEMPTKLKNRDTQLYGAVARCLYKSAPQVLWHRKRPSWLRQYETTATPLENSPQDVPSTIRLIDPDVFPNLAQFEAEFVASRNFHSKKPEAWHKLDKIGLMIDHMVHQVDKGDPDIAKYFPAVLERERIVDWTKAHRKPYDVLTGAARGVVEKDFSEDSILATIGLMQMLCDMPSMVNESAERWEAVRADLEDSIDLHEDIPELDEGKPQGTAQKLLEAIGHKLKDDGHPKVEALRELLLEKHPGEKTLVFSTYNRMILPKLSAKLDEWGIKHVVYSGTDAQKQAAQDAFQNDPEILVFLSSDAGSDSIDLPEASVAIHYDLPWKWSTLIQRQNRLHRVNSQHKTVYVYTLMMADSIEDRKLEIIMMKMGYHNAVFKGAISEDAISARMTKADLVYILTGQWMDL